MQNVNDIKTNKPVKGLVTDLDDSLISPEHWTHMLNGTTNTHDGRIINLTNEPSLKFCAEFPYTPIGFIKILNNRWAVFTTDDVNSEIGIFDETHCTYTKLVNNPCFKFNRKNLIKGAFKEAFDCSEIIYFTDGGLRRKLNLSKYPKTFTLEDDECKSKTFTNELDCEALLITPNVQIPKIDIKIGALGAIRNGSYQVGMAYTVNGQRVTNYYSITNPRSIWSHENSGRSLEIDITNLDRDFDQYELVLISTQENTTTARSIGFFPTSFTRHEISNSERPEYITIPLEDITLDRPYYFAADNVVSNDQYLLWSGVKNRPELNYQRQAMDIVIKWVSYQVPADYYANGGNKIGYLRYEVYSFGIQWLFTNGEWSSVFHTPGRKSIPSDLSLATGKDVFERPEADGSVHTPLAFEITDTSRSRRRIIASSNRERPVMEGLMSYWESSRLYPDNETMFGDDRCTPIRHSKFPSECTAPRYERGGSNINILGVKFENIEHPKDSNGAYITDVVGYRILRGDRSGNRSIIAKGIFTNVKSYNETLNQQGTNDAVLFANYPYNDLRPDPFLSSRQAYNRNGERDFFPLADYKKDQFNFYSPTTLFSQSGLGDQVIFDTEESADVIGHFEDVYNHPRAKILKNSVFWLAILVGAIDGVLSVFGKKCVTSIRDGVMNVSVVSGVPPTAANITYSTVGMQWVQECEGIVNDLRTRDILKLRPLEAIAKLALKTLQTAAKAGMGVYFAFKTANEVIKTVQAFLPWQKFAMQYNSQGLFNQSRCVSEGNRRRHLEYYQYLYDGINVVNGVKFNNSKREKSVYLKLNADVKNPQTIDTTRKTLTDAQICDDVYKSFKSKATVFYGGIKRRLADQYGQLDAINYLDTGFTETNLIYDLNATDRLYKSDIVFGGDIFINKFSVNKSHQFFRQNLSNANFPDGTEYDYSLYRNIGYPRYWVNSEEYDISELIVAGKMPNRLPTNKYNLDCYKSEGSVRSLSIKGVDGKFYLASNGVMQFFVESEYNLDYRDYTRQMPSFYSDKFNNLSELFRSDRWEDKEEFVYDQSHSKELRENALFQQRLDYDPTIDEKCFSYYKNKVIYSLPAFKEQKGDNWLIYLINNYHDFPMAEFGALTSMQPVDNQQIMFLFDKSSPYITIGRDELKTEDGVKVTIGDAGLFAREPRPILYTDFAYGNSQSKWAFVNTQFGSFYPSQRQGRLFKFTGKLEDVARQGMHFWFKEHLPSKLIESFPNYNKSDNPVVGVGLLSVFDNRDERYYLTKRDYALKPFYKGKVSYDPIKDEFKYGTIRVQLTDSEYFEDASFTISYDPKNEFFVSWHDWHPEWMIQGENHFMSVKKKGIWKHNERYDSYCNYYDIDYPFEIEYSINNGPNVQVLRNIEYILEAGKYFNDGRDFHHILDANFDYAIIHNSEQTSGLLRMILPLKGDMNDILNYPRIGTDESIVSYSKEEHKTRLNQFWDLTKDRGEFTHNNFPLWITASNGYIKNINNKAVDYNKSYFYRKKFRHMQHRVFLKKILSGDTKFIFKMAHAKEYASFR